MRACPHEFVKLSSTHYEQSAHHRQENTHRHVACRWRFASCPRRCTTTKCRRILLKAQWLLLLEARPTSRWVGVSRQDAHFVRSRTEGDVVRMMMVHLMHDRALVLRHAEHADVSSPWGLLWSQGIGRPRPAIAGTKVLHRRLGLEALHRPICLLDAHLLAPQGYPRRE